MKRFLIFVIDRESNPAGGDEIKEIDIFNDYLEKNGHWITAGGLASPTQSIVIDNRNDAAIEAPHTLYSGDEHYSGFWLIYAEDGEQARILAFAGSKACNRKVELRPLH